MKGARQIVMKVQVKYTPNTVMIKGDKINTWMVGRSRNEAILVNRRWSFSIHGDKYFILLPRQHHSGKVTEG